MCLTATARAGGHTTVGRVAWSVRRLLLATPLLVGPAEIDHSVMAPSAHPLLYAGAGR